MFSKAKLLGIAARTAPKAPMYELTYTEITLEHGVGTDFRGKPSRRQVTVMTRDSWEAACRELEIEGLGWSNRRANLLVDGVDLEGTTGYDLHVGDAILTITGETTPCPVMEKVHPGLLKALEPNWRGGVTCRVRRPGRIAVGCDVRLTRSVVRQKAWVAYMATGRFGKRCLRQIAFAALRLLGKQKPASVSHDFVGSQ
jgi:MOSC domain-containing protein YiiM